MAREVEVEVDVEPVDRWMERGRKGEGRKEGRRGRREGEKIRGKEGIVMRMDALTYKTKHVYMYYSPSHVRKVAVAC